MLVNTSYANANSGGGGGGGGDLSTPAVNALSYGEYRTILLSNSVTTTRVCAKTPWTRTPPITLTKDNLISVVFTRYVAVTPAGGGVAIFSKEDLGAEKQFSFGVGSYQSQGIPLSVLSAKIYFNDEGDLYMDVRVVSGATNSSICGFITSWATE